MYMSAIATVVRVGWGTGNQEVAGSNATRCYTSAIDEEVSK